MEDYKSNSNKARAAVNEPTREVVPVVDRPATIRKKSLGEKFGEVFFKTDGKDLGTYILSDIVIPSIKDMISDVVRNGIDVLLYGNGRGRNRGSAPRSTGSYVNYANMGKPTVRYADQPDRLSCVCEDVVFEFEKYGNDARKEAEKVTDSLLELISVQDHISLAEYYGMCRLKSQYTDKDWGWYDLASMEVRKVRDGWAIKMPRMVSLK